MLHLLLNAFQETLFMVFTAGFLSLVLGFPLGLLLFFTQSARQTSYTFFNSLLRLIESIPYVILMIAILPLSKWCAAHMDAIQIGPSMVAILPLMLIAIPFFSRLTANALHEVPKGLIQTTEAMGASRLQMIRKCLIPESLPKIIKGFTQTLVYLVGFSTVAGLLGYGGLGQLAMDKGYHHFEIQYLVGIALILTLLVQIIQQSGNYLAHGTLKRS
jgi:ABC-type methionine transport system permease subunit